jgi:hemoglobin
MPDEHPHHEQRFRWVMLIARAADDAALPDDPEFRSAFLPYVERTRPATADR